MAASNTPLYDLIELSGIGANATYTTSPGGGGDIIGFVDNATYTDSEPSNSSTEINELSEADDTHAGSLTIDGVVYDIYVAVPDSSSSDPVTVTHDGGTTNLFGDGGDSEVVFITAIPTGGGATRYFAAFDDRAGDFTNISAIQTRNLDFTPAGDDVEIQLDQNNNITACFTAGTLIDTACGPRPVEGLRPDDMILTLDHGFVPLLWCAQKRHTIVDRGPIVFQRGALGYGMPDRRVIVSPQHRMLVSSPIVERMFGVQQALVPAVRLTTMPGINEVLGQQEVVYCHLYFERHQIVRTAGAWSESLLTDKATIGQLPRGLRPNTAMQPARLLLERGAELNTLLKRHRKNAKPLCSRQNPKGLTPISLVGSQGALGAQRQAQVPKNADL